VKLLQVGVKTAVSIWFAMPDMAKKVRSPKGIPQEARRLRSKRVFPSDWVFMGFLLERSIMGLDEVRPCLDGETKILAE
jgi:hypothetical protein